MSACRHGKKPPFASSQRTLLPVEAALIEATVALLQVDEFADPDNYKQKNIIYQRAVKSYLRHPDARAQKPLAIFRQGTTFIFPLIIDVAEIDPPNEKMPAQHTGLTFAGEILDFAWLGSPENPSDLLILFPDSLVQLQWPLSKQNRPKTIPFPSQKFSRYRAAFPAGSLLKAGTGITMMLTSNLKTAVILQQSAAGLQQAQSINLDDDIAFPAYWKAIEGQGLFFNLNGSKKSFHALRRLVGTEYLVSLDQDGYLLLQHQSGNQIWRSDMPVGNRLFVGKGNTAIVSNRDAARFFVFERQGETFSLKGQSPDFSGNPGAIIQFTGEDKNDAYLCSISGMDDTGTTSSSLQILKADQLQPAERYSSPVTVPDYEQSLTVLVNRADRNSTAACAQGQNGLTAHLIFETLFAGDEKRGPVALLAARLSADPQFRSWTIRLRQNIRFADGSALTTKEIKKGWEEKWRKCAADDCPCQWLWRSVSGADNFVAGRAKTIEGIRLIDNMTLQIKLERALPAFAEHLTQPAFAIQKREKDTPVGTGAFRRAPAAAAANNAAHLIRNPYYHRGMPPLKTIRQVEIGAQVIDHYSDARKPVSAISRQSDIAFFERVKGLRIERQPLDFFYFLGINPDSPQLADQRIRDALKGMLRRTDLAAAITAAQCLPAPVFFKGDTTEVEPLVTMQGPYFQTPLRMVCQADDAVALQISERLTALFVRQGVPVSPPEIMPAARFRQAIKSGDYDLVIDRFLQKFHSSAYNMFSLTQRGYSLHTSIVIYLQDLLSARPDAPAVEIQTQIQKTSVLVPLVRAARFVIIPETLHNVQLTNNSGIHLASAWLPRAPE